MSGGETALSIVVRILYGRGKLREVHTREEIESGGILGAGAPWRKIQMSYGLVRTVMELSAG